MLYTPEPGVPVTAANDPQVADVQATPFSVKLVTVGRSPETSLVTLMLNVLVVPPAWSGGTVLGTTWTVGRVIVPQVT
jgi:hypothetical protein